MAVAIEMRFPNATLDQYNQILGKMGLEPGGGTPPGAIFHWCAQDGDGLRIVDVWESREVFDRFAQEQIGPYSAEAGIEDEPEMVYHDIDNYLAAR
jgi:hypothetical protein